MKALFDKYFMDRNGLWQERVQEVKDKGFEHASSIARLIYSCEIGSGIDQHASEDLKAVSALTMAQAERLTCLEKFRADILAAAALNVNVVAKMEYIQMVIDEQKGQTS